MQVDYIKIIFFILFCSFFTGCLEEPDVLDPETLNKWEYYDQTNGLSDNFIWTIFQDQEGNIWAGTNGGGVNMFDGVVWNRYTINNGLASNTVYAVAQDKDGDMWFGTEGGLNILIGEYMYVFDSIEGDPFLPVTLLHDSQQRMWAGTPGNGIVVFTGENYIPLSITFTANEKFNTVNALAEDNSGTIWIATEGGAIFYKNDEFDLYDSTSGLYSNEVSFIMQDSWGDIWFATLNGEYLTRYDGTNSEHIYMYNGYTTAFVFSMAEDHKSNIWFASGNAGIINFNGIEMYSIKIADRYKEDSFLCNMVDKNGNIWFGTMKNGIAVYISE
jgi:ligand-binding sensor domain-containing protein